MKVAYGPPGATGVTTLMHVGAEEFPQFENIDVNRAARNIGIGAAGVWIWAFVADEKKLRKYALATSLVAFIVQFATKD